MADVPLLFQLVGTELVFTGINFLTIAMTLLGKSESKTAGVIAAFTGPVTMFMGWYELLVMNQPFAGTLGLIFGTAQTTAGIHLYYNLNFKGLGWYSVFGTIALGFYTWQWAVQGLYIWAFFGFTWMMDFVVFIPASLKPTPSAAKIAAYWLIFCAFVTLFIPGLWLMSNLYGFV